MICGCGRVVLPIGVLTMWEPDGETGRIYHTAALCSPGTELEAF